MLEKILHYEHDFFLQLNSFHSTFWDQFMWLFSGKIAWMPAVAFFVTVLLFKNWHRWKEILLIFVAITLVATLCDQFASGFCKSFFERLRPTHHPDFMDKVHTVFDYRGGRYGFISSHAANAFGFATLTSLIFKYRFYSITIFGWATVNSYSRIYLGVHFISDIVPGIITGLFLGWLIFVLYLFIYKKAFAGSIKGDSCEKYPYRYEGLNAIIFMLLLIITVITVLSLLYCFNITPAITAK